MSTKAETLEMATYTEAWEEYAQAEQAIRNSYGDISKFINQLSPTGTPSLDDNFTATADEAIEYFNHLTKKAAHAAAALTLMKLNGERSRNEARQAFWDTFNERNQAAETN